MLDCGLHLLRLPPTVFWALTPIEFSILAYGVKAKRQALDSGTLHRLMRDFPDMPCPISPEYEVCDARDA